MKASTIQLIGQLLGIVALCISPGMLANNQLWAQPSCPGDLNGDGVVDSVDLGVLLSNWDKHDTNLRGDLNNDGTVNVTDLGILLSNWGPCPPPHTQTAGLTGDVTETVFCTAVGELLKVPVCEVVEALTQWARAEVDAHTEFCLGDPDTHENRIFANVDATYISFYSSYTGSADSFVDNILEPALHNWGRQWVVAARWRTRIVQAVSDMYVAHLDLAKTRDSFVNRQAFRGDFQQAFKKGC